jgi:hypothetical protein
MEQMELVESVGWKERLRNLRLSRRGRERASKPPLHRPHGRLELYDFGRHSTVEAHDLRIREVLRP